MSERACRACGNAEGNTAHFPKEMMFGWREVFEYFECGRCGCLQIAEIPADLGKYYPRDAYYSYQPPKAKHYPGWCTSDCGCYASSRCNAGGRSSVGC